MIIPADQLPVETLDRIVREWLMRQGEDWGLVDEGLDNAIPLARAKLLNGELAILWSETEETLNIMHRDEIPRSDQSDDWGGQGAIDSDDIDQSSGDL